MLRSISYLAVIVCISAPRLPAQDAAVPDTVRRLARLDHDWIARHGAVIGAAIWPGYHPESIPTLYVIPHRAKLLVAWRDSAPPGFQPLSGAPGAFWTDTQVVSFPSGRFMAFLSVDSGASAAEVLGLALHERFHAFERRTRREGVRFGGGENSMLTAAYPVFDPAAEAFWAVEGHLLHLAFLARDTAEARRLARRFLAVRERRQAGLDSAFAEYERMAELHEGLAQYAQLAGQLQLERLDSHAWPSAGDRAVWGETRLLDSLLALTHRSVRRRFYVTGSTMGLLLDRLAAADWKRDLVKRDRTVQDALAAAVAYRGVAALGRDWADMLERLIQAARPEADRAVTRLRADRTALVDSILAVPGVRLVLESAADLHLDLCGFDPQNLLAVGDGRMLHARFLNLCAGDAVSAEFDRPVVEMRPRGTFETVITDPAALVLTSGRTRVALPDSGLLELPAFRMEAPGIVVRAPHARVTRSRAELRVAVGP